MTDPDTVTLTRAEYDALMERLEDAEDLAALAQHRHDRRIPGEVVHRTVMGENPVAVWREYRGLTQRALAEVAGISPAMMSEIEKGGGSLSLAVAQALAAALEVELGDLFGELDG